MLKSLAAKARVIIRNPRILGEKVAHRRLAYLNSPNRLDKFKRNHNSYVQRTKKNKVQTPFNSLPPYVSDGNESSNDFYGNPPLLDYRNYEFPENLSVEVEPVPNFCISTTDNGAITPKSGITIKNRTGSSGLSRDDIVNSMRNDYYVRLRSPDKKRNNELVQKKYWFPTSGDVLDAILTAKKLYKFVSFDPLDPLPALKEINFPETRSKKTKERKGIINDRYKRLARAKGMFVLFGVSSYNVNNLRLFLLDQIADFNNCYELGYSKYGYTASYIIPVAFFSEKEENFSENDIVKFYTRPNNEIQRNVDPQYAECQKLVSSEPLPNYNSLEIPGKTVDNENFLTNLSFSLKKRKDEIKEYYLVVIFMSEPEMHENESPICNNQGWYYRPNVHGKLVTVIAKERRDLDVDERNWVDDRINRKGETIK